MHVNFLQTKKYFFDKIAAFWLRQFEVSLQYREASLCNQLLPGFSSSHFKILHRCSKYIEDVHGTFCRRKNSFDKFTAFSTETILRLGFNMGSKFV